MEIDNSLLIDNKAEGERAAGKKPRRGQQHYETKVTILKLSKPGGNRNLIKLNFRKWFGKDYLMAEGRRQKAEGRQRAKGKRQKAAGRRGTWNLELET